jgi:hypothetical protein
MNYEKWKTENENEWSKNQLLENGHVNEFEWNLNEIWMKFEWNLNEIWMKLNEVEWMWMRLNDFDWKRIKMNECEWNVMINREWKGKKKNESERSLECEREWKWVMVLMNYTEQENGGFSSV